MTEFTAGQGPGIVGFAARMPGAIQEVRVEPDQELMIHKDGFLCATKGAQLGVGLQRSITAGMFGGEGFVLQKLSGDCTAWVELGGEVISAELQPGERIMVQPGHVGMFESSVDFFMTSLPGIRNKLFGGGLFLAQLTGPGRVWLQTMTPPELAGALAPYLARAQVVEEVGEAATATGAAVAGGLMRSLFNRS